MIILYLVRHGTTKFNERKILQGQINPDLAKKGISDAQRVGRVLKNVHFDAAYSSDLKRASRTAKIITKTIGFTENVHLSKALREINYGKAAGLRRDAAKRIYPIYKKSASFVFPGGESFLQVQKRSSLFISSLEKKHSNKTILVVTHSGCIRGFLCKLQKKSLDKNLKMSVTHKYIGRLVISNGKLVQYQKLYG